MTRPTLSNLAAIDTRDSRDRQSVQVQRISEGMRKGTISAQDGLNLLREQQRISAVRQEVEGLRKPAGEGAASGQETHQREEKLRAVIEMQARSERAITRAEENGTQEPLARAG
ncbi:hypothetical protein [Archangium primigenium]|uniref:hypothetical protein n=1 Tax=[Archangium] primigenium TaxID=2792470 RepID=UPI00195C8761|nr:hypothetical protein [Archangium primigenium]MBM7118604.1 hypothetical protein [Archangium primigenium]